MYHRFDILVNKRHRLPREYRPDDLTVARVPFDATYEDPKRLLRKEAALALEGLFARAAASGLTLYGISGFRSFERQTEIYQESLENAGSEHTSLYIAPPGGSEHQTGLSVDVSCPTVGLSLTDAFADTQEAQWLKTYAPLYGFILRYPKGKESITGYAWEPWHIRYVTKELAMCLTKTNLTLEEYHDLKTSLAEAYEDPCKFNSL